MSERVREAKRRGHSQPQEVNTCICSVGPGFIHYGKVRMKSLTGPLWIIFHQTPAHFKANKARVGKEVKCWKSPSRTCMSGFPSLWATSGLSTCIRLRTIHHQFYPRHPLLSHSEPSSVPPGRALSTSHGTICAGFHQSPSLSPSGSLAMPHTREHLRCTATARSKYCQKDFIFSSGCLQNCFADILTQVPLKAKHSLPAGQQLVRPVTSSYTCNNEHITQNNLAFKVSVQYKRTTEMVREGRRKASITATRRAEQPIAFPFYHMLAQL